MENNDKQLKGTIVVDTSGLKANAEAAVKEFDKIRTSIDKIPMSLSSMDASFKQMEGLKSDMGKTFKVDPSSLKGIQEYWRANAEGAKEFKDAIKGGGVKPFANALEKANENARKLSNALSPLIQKTLIYQNAVAPEKFKEFDRVLKLIRRDLQLSAEKTDKLANEQKLTQTQTQQLTEKIRKQDGALKNHGRSLETARRKLRDFGNANIMMGRTINRFFTAPIVAGGALAIKSAINVEAGIRKLDVVFSEMGENAERQVQLFSKQFGLAPQTLRESMGQMGDMLVGFGMKQKAAFELTKKLTVKAADLAAFQPGFDFKEISRRFATATTGETESLKPIGIAVLQNDPEFKKAVANYMAMDGSAQNLARSMAIVDQIIKQTYQSVDFLKDHWSTLPVIVARIIEKFKELKNTIGKKLLADLDFAKMIEKIPKYLDEIIQKIKELKKEDIVGYFKTFKKIAITGFALQGSGFLAKFIANTTIAIAGVSSLTKKVIAMKAASLAGSGAATGLAGGITLAGAGIGALVAAGLAGLWKLGDYMVRAADKAALLREELKKAANDSKETPKKIVTDWQKIVSNLVGFDEKYAVLDPEKVKALQDSMEAIKKLKMSQITDSNELTLFLWNFEKWEVVLERINEKLLEQENIRNRLSKNEKDNIDKKLNQSIITDFDYENTFTTEQKYHRLLEHRNNLLNKYHDIEDAGSRGDALKEVLDNERKILELRKSAEQALEKATEGKIVTNANIASSSTIGTSKALEDMYRTTTYEPGKIQEKMASYLQNIKEESKKIVDGLRKVETAITNNKELPDPTHYLDSFDIVTVPVP